MIGIDTNCLLRYALRDDRAQHAAIERRIAALVRSGDEILINDLVLAEFVWTLGSSFLFGRAQQSEAIRGLLEGKQFCFERKEAIVSALQAFESSNAGFVDCLIGAKNRRLGCDTTLTFDKSARKLETFDVV